MNLYLFAAYLLVWTALFLFLVSLSRRQRRIGEDLKALLDQGQKAVDADQGTP